MTLCSCLLTTFEKEIENDPIVQTLQKMIAERLDAHTSNILILLNNAKN